MFRISSTLENRFNSESRTNTSFERCPTECRSQGVWPGTRESGSHLRRTQAQPCGDLEGKVSLTRRTSSRSRTDKALTSSSL